MLSLLVSLLPAALGQPAGAATTSTRGLAYDLVSANGTVSSYGGAANFGGLQNRTLKEPVVGMATTPDGRGYWIATANGAVYARGDARFHGSLGHRPPPGPAHQVIAIASTANGRGYWLCDASGVVHSFGDAPRIPSLKPGKTHQRVVGFAVAPDQRAAWVVTSGGALFRLGRLRYYGGLGHFKLAHPIVALARNTKGTGYWMLDSAGRVFSFGSTRKMGDPAPLSGQAVGLAVAPRSRGFWGASSGGTILHDGVPSLGSPADLSGGQLLVGIATARPAAHGPLAYDLVEANGAVSSFGGAGNFGGAENVAMKEPAVGMAVTPDGRGYWIVTGNGSVYALGDAHFYGSLGQQPVPPAANQIVALVPTPDGQGYWLCDASGIVHAFGDAPHIASLASYNGPPIVSFVVLPDEAGAFAVDSAGDVYPLGQATSFGSLAGETLSHPIVAMALSSGGRGYWLADSAGEVFSFGEAAGGVTPPPMTDPVVGLASPPSGLGYWAVNSAGRVLAGNIPARGGLQGKTLASPVVGIAATLPLSSTERSPYPAGSIGYDVNWPQCRQGSSAAGPLPGPPGYPAHSRNFALAFVGVDGWGTGAPNSCLRAEIAWAGRARVSGRSVAPQYQLYMFINSPSGPNATDKTGPAGNCPKFSGSVRASCYAYNYGYNAALGAVAYAASQGAHAPVWWLDVENDSCASHEWSSAPGAFWSCSPGLNDRTIQGAINALRAERITVGVYSTALQWNRITNHFVPSGAQLPLWIAGAPWTSPPYPASYGYPSPAASSISQWCAGNYDFAGGVPSVLQETPGPNNYPFDPDYAC